MKKHTFSIRLPEDLVITISQRAQVAGRDRNSEITELLRHGLIGAGSLEEAVKKFVFRTVTKEELLKLELGA